MVYELCLILKRNRWRYRHKPSMNP